MMLFWLGSLELIFVPKLPVTAVRFGQPNLAAQPQGSVSYPPQKEINPERTHPRKDLTQEEVDPERDRPKKDLTQEELDPGRIQPRRNSTRQNFATPFQAKQRPPHSWCKAGGVCFVVFALLTGFTLLSCFPFGRFG